MVWCSMVTQGRLAPNATPTLIGDSLGITDVDDTDRDQLRLRTLGFSRRRQARSNKEPSKELTWVMSNSEPTRSIQSFQLMDYRCFATIVQPNHQDAPGYRSQACHARDRVAPSQCCLTQLPQQTTTRLWKRDAGSCSQTSDIASMQRWPHRVFSAN